MRCKMYERGGNAAGGQHRQSEEDTRAVAAVHESAKVPAVYSSNVAGSVFTEM